MKLFIFPSISRKAVLVWSVSSGSTALVTTARSYLTESWTSPSSNRIESILSFFELSVKRLVDVCVSRCCDMVTCWKLLYVLGRANVVTYEGCVKLSLGIYHGA